MKTVGVTALMAGAAMAWPMNMDMITGPLQGGAKAKWLEARDMLEASIAERQAIASPQGAGALPLVPPPFDAKAHAQVSTPWPTMFINGTETVFGMARDLGGFLAIFGAVVDGDGQSWSIGGLPHTGILGSHNNYETDSSPIKSDLNQYGSNTKFLYNRQPNAATANYNLDVLRQFRKDRFTESINKNPYFAYLPFGGIEVSQAAFTFIYRFMSNKSAENPEGILNKNVLKSFMSVTGPENNLKHTPGHERIPNNWYKRNPSDEYSIPYFQTDILYLAAADPRILSIGCNKGQVNTYSPIDPATLTGGAYTAQQVAANPLCFASAFTKAEIPLITGLQLTNPLVAPLVTALDSATSGMQCADIGAVNQSALSACPGFSFYGGPSGPVAPGAVQS
ncbi:hypothetical protein AC578_903 [Pseudocercospora eumusae]|uniref:Heme haloperoxidase family profile domain-containing protein n=1 Tax=Pseudocercospora eumusae TaxID=321146 RepID=A0A139HBX2_9PEZI|nr:hypothetical protein AC578_903 [Pseudocercospora eumusae]